MERKIGEIFEYNGEWYQCVECDSCGKCSLRTTECGIGTKSDLADEVFGECSKIRRSDSKHAIFKKLEKVGEPFTCNIHKDERLVWMQEYKLYDVKFCKENALLMYVSDYKHKRIAIEIKQNKEDMEEKKLNLKPFDIQKAREGKPVCTRDGRKARIICFDAKDNLPIIALIINARGDESLARYKLNGRFINLNESDCDLMMLPERKEGWINVYNNPTTHNIYTSADVFESKEIAEEQGTQRNRIATCKIAWEE